MPEIDDEQTAETSETPEEELDDTNPDDTGTPDEDTDETDEDDDTSDDEGDEEDVDEDEGLPDGVRQLRAALRAEGYTFDAEGNAVKPETPAAPAGEVPAKATEAPAETVETPAAEPLTHPTEFQGFSVRADGMDLFDLAFEDPASEDAQGLIHGTEDENGNAVSEGIGEAAYVNLLHKYNRAKDAYAQDFDSRVENSSLSEMPVFNQRVQAARDGLKADFIALQIDDAQANEALGSFYERANQEIKKYIDERTKDFISEGMTVKRAGILANKEVLDNPEAYDIAMTIAFKNDRRGFIQGVVNAARAGASPVKPAPTAPPRPAVPSVSRPGSGSSPAPGTTAAITPTREEKEMARMRGLTSNADINKYVRDLRQYVKA